MIFHILNQVLEKILSANDIIFNFKICLDHIRLTRLFSEDCSNKKKKRVRSISKWSFQGCQSPGNVGEWEKKLRDAKQSWKGKNNECIKIGELNLIIGNEREFKSISIHHDLYWKLPCPIQQKDRHKNFSRKKQPLSKCILIQAG